MGDLTMINFVGCFYFLCVAFCVFSYSSMNNETLIAYIPRENSQMTVQEVPPQSPGDMSVVVKFLDAIKDYEAGESEAVEVCLPTS